MEYITDETFQAIAKENLLSEPDYGTIWTEEVIHFDEKFEMPDFSKSIITLQLEFFTKKKGLSIKSLGNPILFNRSLFSSQQGGFADFSTEFLLSDSLK